MRLTCKPLLIFSVSTVICHFANAAMLPLVGQKLASVNRNLGTLLMSTCIIAAQLVTVPVTMLVGRKVDAWDREPIFVVAASSSSTRATAPHFCSLRPSLVPG